jgi:hypothetical protein
MPDKYNLAPVDKHAADPRQVLRSDKNRDKLEKDLEDTFPASDPSSSTEPSKARSGLIVCELNRTGSQLWNQNAAVVLTRPCFETQGQFHDTQIAVRRISALLPQSRP